MTKIHIPPAALEAGARALAEDAKLNWDDIPQTHNILRREARAAFVAMVEAWEGAEYRPTFGPSRIILPIMEKTDDKA